jgi:hypothetical protein
MLTTITRQPTWPKPASSAWGNFNSSNDLQANALPTTTVIHKDIGSTSAAAAGEPPFSILNRGFPASIRAVDTRCAPGALNRNAYRNLVHLDTLATREQRNSVHLSRHLAHWRAPLLRGTSPTEYTIVRTNDRLFGGDAPPTAVFFYSPDRASIHPEQHLAGYCGIHTAKLNEWLLQGGGRAQARPYSHPRSPNTERSSPGGAYHPAEP